jgi:hypothetical protein
MIRFNLIGSRPGAAVDGLLTVSESSSRTFRARETPNHLARWRERGDVVDDGVVQPDPRQQRS